MKRSRSLAAKKAHRTIRNRKRVAAVRRTAKWAVTMTRWMITRVVRRRGIRARKWNVVQFTGKGGNESAGVVDLVAIRKNQRVAVRGFKRGDLFDIVLIQVKGGASRAPT